MGKEAIKSMKDEKAVEWYGVPGEVWKYGGKELEEWVWRLCNKTWKGNGWPESWKEGEIIPLIKGGG